MGTAGKYFNLCRNKAKSKCNQYYALLKEAHERTDWSNRESVHAYNEYARELRKQMSKEADK